MKTAQECLATLLETLNRQKQLAEKLNVTEASVSRYLSGERDPDADVAYKIAALTHTELTRKDGRWYFRRKYQTKHAS